MLAFQVIFEQIEFYVEINFKWSNILSPSFQMVFEQKEFLIDFDKTYTAMVSPSAPIFYQVCQVELEKKRNSFDYFY